MFVKAEKYFTHQPPFFLIVISLLLVMIVAIVDHFTGYELSFSLFYLVPVGFAGWYLNAKFGYFISIISALCWLLLEVVSDHDYSNHIIAYWNAAVRLSFFVIVTFLLGKLQQALKLQLSLAQTDGLTGLLNARAFKQQCRAVLDLSRRNKHKIAIGYIDLDGFKSINDKLGHTVGDLVLTKVAETISQRLRGSDVASRLGGDEFSIILPETDLAGANVLFDGFLKSLQELVLANHWPVGFSIGVAVFNSSDCTVDEVIRIADALMYQVKHSGKNGIIYREYGHLND